MPFLISLNNSVSPVVPAFIVGSAHSPFTALLNIK